MVDPDAQFLMDSKNVVEFHKPHDPNPYSLQLPNGQWFTFVVVPGGRGELRIPYLRIDGIPAHATIDATGQLIITMESGLGEMPERPR